MRKVKVKIGFVIAALIAVFVFTGFSDEVSEKYVGVQLYSVRDHMKKDPKGTIEKIGAMGFKFVEAAGYGAGKFYGMSPAEFKAHCEKNGLEFVSSHTGKNLPNEENWDKTMAWWDKAIEAHSAAGVKYIVQPWMSKEGYESLDGLKAYVKYFEAVGEKCRKKGIIFGYHNHDKEFTTEFDGKPLFNHMLELSDPEKLTFELDLYWVNKGGKNSLDYFKEYPGRFPLWHIKDEKELGESGEIDFEPIFAAKKQSGLQYGIVEVERYNFDPLVSVEKSLDYLKGSNY